MHCYPRTASPERHVSPTQLVFPHTFPQVFCQHSHTKHSAEGGGCFAAATRPVTGSSTHPHLLRHAMPRAPQLSSAVLAVENKPGASWGFPSISSCFGSVSQNREKKGKKEKRQAALPFGATLTGPQPCRAFSGPCPMPAALSSLMLSVRRQLGGFSFPKRSSNYNPIQLI